MIETLQERVNANPWLIHRGRFLETRCLIEIGEMPWLLQIHAGRVAQLTCGPFVMPRWVFALRASEHTWARFWSAVPEPGFHDLMAMIKFRTLRLEGDQHPFMAHLLYFKDVLAAPRRSVDASSESRDALQTSRDALQVPSPVLGQDASTPGQEQSR